MNAREELIRRWDSFLQKIEIRFNESLQHAEVACLEQLQATDYEYETVLRSWMGMKAQIDTLIAKIDIVWDTKVMPEMREIGDFYIDEGYKASETGDRLTEVLFRFQRKLEGQLSQLFYDHAITSANKKVPCSQCNADLEIRKDIFRVQYNTCQYCNTVNTVAPETKFLKIGWGIVDNIAAMNAQKEYDLLKAAENVLHEQRKSDRNDSHWSTYENAYFDYWERFFQERIKLNSDMAERYGDDMQRKRTEFENYKKVQTS